MSFTELSTGPWRGVAFLVGTDAPDDAPADCVSLMWRHDGTARLAGPLERAQAQVLIDASQTPEQSKRARPEPFALRNVTTTVAGEGFVFAGELFGQTGPIETPDEIVVAQLTLAPDTEVAFEVREDFEYALIAPDGDLTLNGDSVPERAVGQVGTGHKHLGVINCSPNIAHALLIGGRPASQKS